MAQSKTKSEEVEVPTLEYSRALVEIRRISRQPGHDFAGKINRISEVIATVSPKGRSRDEGDRNRKRTGGKDRKG